MGAKDIRQDRRLGPAYRRLRPGCAGCVSKLCHALSNLSLFGIILHIFHVFHRKRQIGDGIAHMHHAGSARQCMDGWSMHCCAEALRSNSKELFYSEIESVWSTSSRTHRWGVVRYLLITVDGVIIFCVMYKQRDDSELSVGISMDNFQLGAILANFQFI